MIGGGGVRLVEHFAEVDEMRLRGGALCERAGLPAGDEFSKRERHDRNHSGVKFNSCRVGRGWGVFGGMLRTERGMRTLAVTGWCAIEGRLRSIAPHSANRWKLVSLGV